MRRADSGRSQAIGIASAWRVASIQQARPSAHPAAPFAPRPRRRGKRSRERGMSRGMASIGTVFRAAPALKQRSVCGNTPNTGLTRNSRSFHSTRRLPHRAAGARGWRGCARWRCAMIIGSAAIVTRSVRGTPHSTPCSHYCKHLTKEIMRYLRLLPLLFLSACEFFVGRVVSVNETCTQQFYPLTRDSTVVDSVAMITCTPED